MVRRIGLLSALLLMLPIGSSFVLTPTPASGEWPPAAFGGPDLRPVVTRHDAFASYLTPIDPETLDDAEAPIDFRLPGIEYANAWWCASDDGATIATVEGESMVVRDATTLATRHRFPLGWQLFWCAISHDGSRLVVAVLADRQLSGSPIRWQTYDLRTGAELSVIVGAHVGALEYWIDPEARALYRLAWENPAGPSDSGPKHPTLIVYDLDAGRMRAKAELRDVVAGGWWQGTADSSVSDGGFPVMYAPAGLLLPDGERFVVVHLGRDALTIVETETMTIERTVAIERSTGRAEHLLGLVGLAPDSAVAAAMEGATLEMALQPDGRHLYVTGHSWRPAGDGYDSTGLGLLLIDLNSSTIVAELPNGIGFYELEPSSDGRSLYALGPRQDDATNSSLELRRLDATTLETLASRPLTTGSTLDLIPATVLAAVDGASAGG